MMKKFWIFFQNTLDIPIYLGLLSTCPAPPRGALEGAQVCGAAEGGAGDAALRLRGLAGSQLRRGRCGGRDGCYAAFDTAAQAVRSRGAQPRSTSDQWRFLCIWCSHTSGAMPRHKGLSSQRWIGTLPERVGA